MIVGEVGLGVYKGCLGHAQLGQSKVKLRNRVRGDEKQVPKSSISQGSASSQFILEFVCGDCA